MLSGQIKWFIKLELTWIAQNAAMNKSPSFAIILMIDLFIQRNSSQIIFFWNCNCLFNYQWTTELLALGSFVFIILFRNHWREHESLTNLNSWTLYLGVLGYMKQSSSWFVFWMHCTLFSNKISSFFKTSWTIDCIWTMFTFFNVYLWTMCFSQNFEVLIISME